jgi:hypothetical protein
MVGWKHSLAICVGVLILLSALDAGAECRVNDCRRIGVSIGGRQFVFGNAAGDDRTFFAAAFEVGLGGPYVALEIDTAVTKAFQLFGAALLLRAPINLGGSETLQLEPTLGLGTDVWFWKLENRKANGISLRLNPRMRFVWNANKSLAMTVDLISVEYLPAHYSFDTKRKSSHAWVWMSFGVGLYARF